MIRSWPKLLLIGLISSCAAPVGSRAVNPACVWRCVVTVEDITGNPALASVTLSGTGTGGSVTRSKTTTETNTED